MNTITLTYDDLTKRLIEKKRQGLHFALKQFRERPESFEGIIQYMIGEYDKEIEALQKSMESAK